MASRILAASALGLTLLLAGCSTKGEDPVVKLNGNFKATSAVLKGAPKDLKSNCEITANFNNGECLIMEVGLKGGAMATSPFGGKSQVTVDAKKKPAYIDFMQIEGEDAGKPRSGIYEFEGSTLKICFAEPNKPRPTEFSAAVDVTVLILEPLTP